MVQRPDDKEKDSDVDELRALYSDLMERINRLEEGSIRELAYNLDGIESRLLSHIARHKHFRGNRRKRFLVKTRHIAKPIGKSGVLLRGFFKDSVNAAEAEKYIRSIRKKWRIS